MASLSKLSMAAAVVLTAVWLLLKVPPRFVLNGETLMTAGLESVYEDPGASLSWLGFGCPELVETHGSVDTSEAGIYTIEYSYSIQGHEGSLFRTVEVRDLTPPVITIKTEGLLVCELGEELEWKPQVSAYDEIDGDVSESIVIDYPFDDSYGYRLILVRAYDHSGNEAAVPQMVLYTDGTAPEDLSLPEGIFSMEVFEDVWRMQARIESESDGPFEAFLEDGDRRIVLDSKPLSTRNMEYFEISKLLTEIPEGDYDLVVKQGEKETRISAESVYDARRQGRRRVNGLLYTWQYEDGLSLSVEEKDYDYDIAIDVGHGDDDGGALAVDGTDEAVMNLEVALYEKARYESMGLKVWLIRDEQEYEELLENEDWPMTWRVGWTTGWYGAQSRYTYSIHHNSDGAGEHRGPEIIVNPTGDPEELEVAYRLYKEYEEIYPVITTSHRIFTRDYMTGEFFDRSSGREFPGIRMYYANHRIPKECFGVNVITYEGCYVNNAEDYDWYWLKKGWKEASERRIQAYCEALCMKYIAPE